MSFAKVLSLIASAFGFAPAPKSERTVKPWVAAQNARLHAHDAAIRKHNADCTSRQVLRRGAFVAAMQSTNEAEAQRMVPVRQAQFEKRRLKVAKKPVPQELRDAANSTPEKRASRRHLARTVAGWSYALTRQELASEGVLA